MVELDTAINATELTVLKFGLKTLIKADVTDSDADRIYIFERASEDWMKVGKSNWEAATIEKYQGLLNNFILKAFGRFLLKASGKCAKIALMACMHKLLTILNAMVKKNPVGPQIYAAHLRVRQY